MVTDAAAEVDMAHFGERVVSVAQTVFLRAGSVVDGVEQVVVAQQGEGAEEGGLIYRGQRLLKVGQVEDAGVVADDGALSALYESLSSSQCTHGVQHGEHGDTDVGEDGHP